MSKSQCSQLPLLKHPLNKTLERKLLSNMRDEMPEKSCQQNQAGQIRNEDIRAMVRATSILQHIEQQRVKWFRHLTRMSPKQPALRAYNTRHWLESKRKTEKTEKEME